MVGFAINMSILSLVLAVALIAGQPPAAAPPRPDFTGVWTLDGFMGRGPLGFRNFRSICELPGEKMSAAGVYESPGDDQLQSIGNVEGELKINQNATQISIERRYSGSLGSGALKDILNLDGSETVNTNGIVKGTSRSRWEGAGLVVDHQLRWTADGKEVGCNVREAFVLTDTNTLSLVATNNEAEGSTTARQTYVRKRQY